MICFNCGIKLDNSDEKGCRFCGVAFSVRCSSCGAFGPKTARFCLTCGNRLPRQDERSSAEGGGALAEGRKNVAVIFADISGFTAISEKMDPEEVREIINECFNYITGPVYELEGTIDKYMGDCVMILFGARYAHPDDAARAVTCAMKMMELADDFSRGILSQKGVVLKLSIGINYGLVVTGGVGNYFDRDYTVMGDIVNTAQRLQSNAGRGSILVSESIHTETRDVFEYSEPNTVKVKNREAPVKCYVLLKSRTDRFAGREQTFLERQREIGLLNTKYNEAQNSGLTCVNIIGEVGMGKTRLLREFASKVGNDVKKVWTDCSALLKNRSYSLLSGILSGIMSINPTDSNSMRQHRLISFLDYILAGYSDEEIKRNYDFIGLLLGLDRDTEFQGIFQAMSYDGIKREILKQLSLFFVSLCKKQKLLVIADDLQWADAASLQLLDELFPLIGEAKAVFLFSSRYESRLLSGKDNPDIVLGRLTREAAENLACGVLGCARLDGALLDAIIGITKGNPLYIKELTAGIKRKEAYTSRDGTAYLEKEELESLPSSIQNLIASKISGLEDGSLRLLQAASVIGREFRLSILDHILEEPADEAGISGLPIQLGIIRVKAVHTSSKAVERVYEFSHDIEREVIYDSILNRDKRMLHKKTAEYIETEFKKDIENYYELLCEHYGRAGMLRRAADYSYNAALKLKRQYSLHEALEYFGRFLEFSENAGGGGDPRVPGCYREIGHIHFINANYNDAIENIEKSYGLAAGKEDKHRAKLLAAEVYRDQGQLEPAMAILDEIGSRIGEGNPLYGGWLQLKCSILRIQGDPAALGLVRKSEKILLKARDFRNLSEMMKHAGMICFTRGEIDNALSYMGKSYKYAEKNHLPDILARVSGDMGIIYHSTGVVSRAMEFLEKSMDISRKLLYRRGIMAAGINLGILYLDKGMFTASRKLFNESLEMCREVGSKLYECICMTNLGDVGYELGDFESSRRNYIDSMELARSISAPIEEGVNRIGLARVLLKTGENAEAGRLLEQAHAIFVETDETSYSADYYTCRGQLAQAAGDYGAALADYESAAAAAGDCRNTRKILKASRLKGTLLLLTDRPAEAVPVFEAAAEAAEALDSDYEAAKCWFGVYEAQKAAGRLEEAGSSLGMAEACAGRVDRCRWTEKINRECLAYMQNHVRPDKK